MKYFALLFTVYLMFRYVKVKRLEFAIFDHVKTSHFKSRATILESNYIITKIKVLS